MSLHFPCLLILLLLPPMGVYFNMHLADINSIEDDFLHVDLPCEKFRNLFDVDQVSKITVVVDCIYDDLTQVINHVIPTNTCAMQCNNV